MARRWLTIRLQSACHQNEMNRQKGCSPNTAEKASFSLREIFVYSTFYLFLCSQWCLCRLQCSRSLDCVKRELGASLKPSAGKQPFPWLCSTGFAHWHSRTVWGDRRREAGMLVRSELHLHHIGSSRKALQLSSSRSTASVGSRRACGEQPKPSAACLFWREGQLAGSSWM